MGSLIGVVVGFFLSQLANYMRDSSIKKRERRSIRNLLSMELEQNLNLLKDYWHDVSLEPDEDESDENHTVRLVRRSKEIPYPPLLSDAWRSHIGRLSEVLDENELKDVWQQYEIARFLPILLERLINAEPDDESREFGYARASRALREQGLTTATFRSEGAALMMEYKTLISKSIKLGNPLVTSK